MVYDSSTIWMNLSPYLWLTESRKVKIPINSKYITERFLFSLEIITKKNEFCTKGKVHIYKECPKVFYFW